MTPLYLLILQFLAFQTERIIFRIFQDVVWFFNGMRKKIQEAKDPRNYATSARVSKLRKCHIFDPWLAYNNPSNLITTHKGFVHPEYVLKDEVSLYSVSKSEALFIEAPPGVEVWKNKYSAFHRIAQHEYAVNVISMPLTSFYRLANELGEIKETLIFLDFVPRSGSTLLGQVFEETGVCVSYSEPSVLSMVWDDYDEKAFKKVIKAAVRFYTKPRSSRTQAFVFKYLPVGRPFPAFLHEVFPEAHFFHMARNALPSIASSIKIRSIMPLARLLRVFYSIPFFSYYFRMSGIRAGALNENNNKDYLNIYFKFKKVWHTECLPWFVGNHVYRKSRKNLPLYVCVKYEDLVNNPRENLEILFERCGLSADLVDDALAAFSKDSQAGSSLSQDGLSKLRQEHLDSDCLHYWQQFADYFGFDNWESDTRLPGTITKP